jgi:glyoxylase-like metal-dependent hydrolase (beta-lactamase superfamily II)
MAKVQVESFFEPQTDTFAHVVHDPATKKAAVIDAVLDYDQFSGHTSTKFADKIIAAVQAQGLSVDWVLDTHIHADHITAASYIQQQLGGKIGIGAHIKDVLAYWVPIFNTRADTALDGSQFDVLLREGETIPLGSLSINVLHTPGHTPACCCYWVEDAAFVGDTIFMPDVGTARTDFPGGSAATMFDSVRKILSLPESTRLFMCHDYPPAGREVACVTTVGEQKKHNVMVHDGILKEDYVAMRNKRDDGKPVPKMLLPSIQTNLRAGDFGLPEDNGKQYVKIPVEPEKS